MNFSNKMGWMAFLIALSSLPANPTSAASIENNAPLTIENRLTRLSSSFKEKAAQLPEQAPNPEGDIALGWADGRGNRGFVNGRGGGWGNGGRGGFLNSNPWRNGWGDRGSFFNRSPWRNGSFFNRY